MTNAADTYYGALFSNLSYGMGENGTVSNRPQITVPRDNSHIIDGGGTDAAAAAAAATAAAMAAAAAASGGCVDWSGQSAYPAHSTVLTGLGNSSSLSATVDNSIVNDPSGPITSSNLNQSPYEDTLLAAVAAAAAAAYLPPTGAQPSNSVPSPTRPFISPETSLNTIQPIPSELAAFFFRLGHGQPASSAVGSVYTTNPTFHADGSLANWSYSVPPTSHYATNSTNMVDPTLLPMVDGSWSSPVGQQRQTIVSPALCADHDVAAASLAHSHQLSSQQGQPYVQNQLLSEGNGMGIMRKDVGATQMQYYPPLQHIRGIPTDYSRPLTNLANYPSQHSSADNPMASQQVVGSDRIMLVNGQSIPISTSHQTIIMNGVGERFSDNSVSMQDPHHQSHSNHEQQHRLAEEFGRIGLNQTNSTSITEAYTNSDRAYSQSTAYLQGSTDRRHPTHQQKPNPPGSHWTYGVAGNGNHAVDFEQKTHIGGVIRPNISTGSMLLSTDSLSTTHSVQSTQQCIPAASDSTRTKTWANVAKQPPKGSAAVLLNSTSWSAKRLGGHPASMTTGRTNMVRSLSTQLPKGSATITPSSQSSTRTKVEGQRSPTYRSGVMDGTDRSGLSGNFPNSTPNRSLGMRSCDEPVLQHESEELHQRLSKVINPTNFDTNMEKARCFVIKSFSEDDIHRSIKYSIWCSTELGNKKLDYAFAETNHEYPIYLFYSVNGSGHFCGMAEMTSRVDYGTRASVWAQDKWQGQFSVRWIFVKDVPNTALRHIRVETNENKPVTHSRDTTELPFERGRQVMQVFATFTHTLSIFDDFLFYEQRERQEGFRRKELGSRRT